MASNFDDRIAEHLDVEQETATEADTAPEVAEEDHAVAADVPDEVATVVPHPLPEGVVLR